MTEIGEMWNDHKADQRHRREDRLPKRIAKVESWGIPFRRLNGDYHLRFELDDGRVVDYWPVHSVIEIRVPGKKARKAHGIDRLKKELDLM